MPSVLLRRATLVLFVELATLTIQRYLLPSTRKTFWNRHKTSFKNTCSSGLCNCHFICIRSLGSE
ncbi:hypothetical protein DB43_AT00100 [Parachlamydia acanthamoebae]|uniref:Uncharacterized protein n=1 Tax=Parachlamydia acanthamoebae TaxID=83552 RepID=A0A0C1EHP8_9BACT|nr:hypothetical protein DB43_AT00100 [Parachlamydia acanthamoebae]